MTLTPFRYPGAKNKLLPILMKEISPLVQEYPHFMDVFVGGGSVLLEVAKTFPKVKLYANDKDYWVYSFWNIVAGDDSKKLDELLSLIDQHPTLELFYKLREEKVMDDVGAAYRAIFFNRTTFSGIAYSGPIGGKNQQSKYTIDCRYNSKKIKEKIKSCRDLLIGRTKVTNNDFSEFHEFIDSSRPAYLDPPYYVKGDALYTEKMNHAAHQELSNILHLRDSWVLSYDDCPEIRNMYQDQNVIDLAARYCINGKKDSWENKNELIILPKTKE